MNEYESLDMALEYLNEGKVPDKAVAVKEILKKVAGKLVTAAIVIALLPLIIIALAIWGISYLNESKKQKDLDELLKSNPELKQSLLNLAKKNQDIIASKCKDFKKVNVEIDKRNLSSKNKILRIPLGYWFPENLDRGEILNIYVDNFVDMDNYPDFDSKEEYIDYLAGIDVTETLREFCGEDTNEMLDILEKKYHLRKSFDNYLQLVDEIDKTYNSTTNSTLLSVTVDHESKISKEDEPFEICFESIDAGNCNLILKYQDYKNIKLPDSVKTLVNAEIQKRVNK